MNTFHLYTLLLFLLILGACDQFSEDLAPSGESSLDLSSDLQGTANAPLFLDLKTTLKTEGLVSFSIEKTPERGQAQITQSAILEYRPNEDFLKGTDLIMIGLLDGSNRLIDTDSVLIHIGIDSLGCPTLAVSDYYHIDKDASHVIAPLANDLICGDISNLEVTFPNLNIEGSLEALVNDTSHFEFIYTPAQGFTGIESFLYKLSYMDTAGKKRSSLSEIKIDVLSVDSIGGCTADTILYYITDQPVQASYLIEAYNPTGPCDIGHWSLDILGVSQGTAQVAANKPGYIEYFPGSSSGWQEISYSINSPQTTIYNTILVSIGYTTDSADVTDSCMLKAVNDTYYLGTDSVQVSPQYTYKLDVKSNDVTCSSSPMVSVITYTGVGTVNVTPDNYILYEVNEEFAGEKKTFITYELCEDEQCAQAEVIITINR